MEEDQEEDGGTQEGQNQDVVGNADRGGSRQSKW